MLTLARFFLLLLLLSIQKVYDLFIMQLFITFTDKNIALNVYNVVLGESVHWNLCFSVTFAILNEHWGNLFLRAPGGGGGKRKEDLHSRSIHHSRSFFLFRDNEKLSVIRMQKKRIWTVGNKRKSSFFLSPLRKEKTRKKNALSSGQCRIEDATGIFLHQLNSLTLVYQTKGWRCC